jgi:hypothetical protein
MILLVGGLFVWELASVRPHVLLGLVAGSLIGASCAARIDGFISVIPATAVFSLSIAGRGAPGEQGLDWYLGPVVLAIGVVGLIALVWKGLQTQGPRSSLLLSALVAATTIVYVHDPNISAKLVRRWRGPRWFPTTAWVAGALVFILPAALVTLPLRDTRVEFPMRQGVDAVCDAARPNAAILVTGPGHTVITLPDSLRAFCGVPTGATATSAPLMSSGWRTNRPRRAATSWS